jgi:16S rRNA (guanine527-N7)-methyltransferase
VATTLPRRIAERAVIAGLNISEAQAEGLALYCELLELWNRRINLTSIPIEGFPELFLDRIIVEPIVIKGLIPQVCQWFDLGSGGGSPAVPLKVVRPDLALTMVESRSRKCAFLREVVGRLSLSASTVKTARIEELAGPAFYRIADLVTVRAVRVNEALFSAAAHLLRKGGRLALFGTALAPDAGDFPFRYMEASPLPGGDRFVHWSERQ